MPKVIRNITQDKVLQQSLPKNYIPLQQSHSDQLWLNQWNIHRLWYDCSSRLFWGHKLKCRPFSFLLVFRCNVAWQHDESLIHLHIFQVSTNKDTPRCLNESTTPLQQWGFRQYLPFSWTTLRGNSILLHSGLNPAWHFWLSTRFSCCLKMKSVENILG